MTTEESNGIVGAIICGVIGTLAMVIAFNLNPGVSGFGFFTWVAGIFQGMGLAVACSAASK